MKKKKIVIAGGTGFIGSALMNYFGKDNSIVILSRKLSETDNNAFTTFTIPKEIQKNVRTVYWNAKDEGAWTSEIDGSDIVINLTGKSVNCRYTSKNKAIIFDSRTNATKAIGNAIAKAKEPPKIWLNASSATIYRNANDKPQDEITGEYHNDFSVQVCKLWEKTFFEFNTPSTRKIALRMAITLGNGGVMIPYINLCKWGLGGKQGNGKQMFSWVHAEDVCRSIEFFEAHDELEGFFNISSPNPVSNKLFMGTMRKATDNKIGLPAYKWMLQMGASLIGTETELLLKSRWVVPTKLTAAGFQFKYPILENALEEIIGKLPRRKYHLL